MNTLEQLDLILTGMALSAMGISMFFVRELIKSLKRKGKQDR